MPLEHFAQVGRHSLAIPGILHYASVHLRQGCAQKMFPGGRDVAAGYSDLQPPKSARVAVVREGKGFTFPTQ